MSDQYKHGDRVPSDVLCRRLGELSDAVTKGQAAVLREFTMRVPAELDRDADLVLSAASRRIAELEARLAAAEADAGRSQNALQKIQSWCEAYPLDIFPEPDWAEVKNRLEPQLLSRVSASNMRRVVEGVKALCKSEL